MHTQYDTKKRHGWRKWGNVSLKGSDTVLLTSYSMAQLAGYWPNRKELLKSKLSSEDEDYTFWLSKETKKSKSVIKWKGSITVLKDFLRKKFGCKD